MSLRQVLSRCRHNFRRYRRSRCPHIGHKISNREVGLVSHCRNDRNPRVEDGSGYDLFIERPQIFDRATASGHD